MKGNNRPIPVIRIGLKCSSELPVLTPVADDNELSPAESHGNFETGLFPVRFYEGSDGVHYCFLKAGKLMLGTELAIVLFRVCLPL